MPICKIKGTIYNSDETPAALVIVYAVPAMSPSISSTGFAILPIPVQTLSSSTGYFEFNLMIGVEFVVTIAALGFREKIVVPNAISYDLFNATSVPFGDEPQTPPTQNPEW